MMVQPPQRRGLQRDSKGEEGAALLLVLAAIALLSMIVGSALRAAHANSETARLSLREMMVEETARAGIDLAKAEIASMGKTERRKGHFQRSLGAAHLEVDFYAEVGRADVNRASPDLLKALFSHADLSKSEVEEIVDAIVDQRQMEVNDYVPTAAGTAYMASQATDEQTVSKLQAGSQFLLLMPEMRPQVFAAIENMITPCSGSATIDPGLAPLPVLTALMDGDRARAVAFMRASANQAPTEVTPERFSLPMRPFIATTSGTAVGFRLRIQSEVDGLRRVFTAVICAPQGRIASSRIVEWRGSP